jgi:Carboxypeptidase regulatory-like domain/TonB dependent receptor
VVYLALLVLGAGRGLHAQTGLTGGSLQGSVRDGSGAGLAGALVTLVEEGTGIVRTTSTDAEGRYVLPALAVGTHRLRVAAPGFKAWEREGLLAAVGRALVVDVGLVLAASEAVTVHREGTSDGNQGAAVAALTEARSIDGLPANGRDFVAFSLLSPAVVSERTPPTGPTASSGLSFAGQRARANHVMVDGFDNDDAYTGAVAAAFSQEAVREFQVLAASAPAEFGHAAGGTVNTVTKSGSNDWHGSAFFFLRDSTLNSKEHFEKFDVFGNPVDAPKGPFHQAQWGATLGGPLRKDRTFAFLSFERRSLDAANFVNIDEGVAAALEAAGFEVALGSAPYAQRDWSALAKIDHTFTPNHRLTVRGHLSDRTNENIEPFGGIVARSHGAVQLRRDFGIAAATTDVFSSGWVNEGRLQLVHGDQDIYGLDPACGGPCRDVHQGGPEVTLPGLAVAGRQLNSPQLRGNLDLQLADTLTRSLGRHAIKAGFDIDLIWRDGGLAQDFGGRYVFTALPAIPGLVSRPLSPFEAFDQGLPALYFQGYGGTTASGTTRLYSVFAQDRFRVQPWLTVEAGLRYQRYALGLAPVAVSDLDGTTLTYEVPDRGDLAPRLSITVDPSGQGRTSLRASYGLFHEDPLLITALVTEIVNGHNLRLLRASLPLSAQAWRSPDHRLPEPSTPFPSVVQVAGPGFGVGYARQLSVGFTQQLGRDITLSLDALSVRGHRLLGIVDYNPLVPALGPGRRPNDRDGRAGSTTSVNQFLNYGEGWYRGLAISLRKRMGHGFEALASYTLSDADDTVSDMVGQVNVTEDPGRGRDLQDPAGAPLGFDPGPFRGPSAVDQRHRFVLSALGRLPWKLELSGIVTVGSGRPFTALSGVDSNGDGLTVTDRARRDPRDPATRVQRNGERLPGTATVDARLSRRFALPRNTALEVLVEAFNLANRVNYTDVNNIFGPRSFPDEPQRDELGRVTYGGYTKAGAPRQVQIAARLSF